MAGKTKTILHLDAKVLEYSLTLGELAVYLDILDACSKPAPRTPNYQRCFAATYPDNGAKTWQTMYEQAVHSLVTKGLIDYDPNVQVVSILDLP